MKIISFSPSLHITIKSHGLVSKLSLKCHTDDLDIIDTSLNHSVGVQQNQEV